MQEIFDFLKNVWYTMGSLYPHAKVINSLIVGAISTMIGFRAYYKIIGFFFTRKFKPAKNNHKYAILIPARNESKVIGHLLDSIAEQDYPQDLITVFVIADNCSDNTAEIARNKGAICYERFDNERRTKGFALQYLFERIEEDYGRTSFEGYFIFDADNLLKPDYISRMNDSFDAGEKIITSYRNTKNLDESWLASTYALHWIRSIRFNHRARSVLRLATNIQGTGFLFSNEIVRDGWKYTSLTEDRALTADAVAQGYKISYNDAAEFFDEQPNSLKVAFRQRLRWSKGHLLAFAETGPKLFCNIIFGKLFLKNAWDQSSKKKPKTFVGFIGSVIESIRHRWASYDTLMQLTPFNIIYLFLWLALTVFLYSCYISINGASPAYFFKGGSYFGSVMRVLFPFKISLEPGVGTFFLSALILVWWKILARIGNYFKNTWTAVYLFIVERKRLVKIPFYKKVIYSFTWPMFDIIGRYTQYIALFVKVTWKPTPHNSKVTMKEITEKKKKRQK